MTKSKGIKLAWVGLAFISICGAVVFRQDMVDSWHARAENKRALELSRQGKWMDALQAAYDATELRPGSADYQLAYTKIRRSLLKATKLRLAALDPVTYLAEVHKLTTDLGPALDDDGETQLQTWCTEHETAAIEEARAPFDADMDALGKVFKGREDSFVDLFSPGNQTKARSLLSAWQSFDSADAAWKTNDVDQVAILLEKIPADYRKSIYDSLQRRLDGPRREIKDRWEAANKLAIQNDFLGAKAIFTELQRHEAWTPGLQQARVSAQSGGEGFFTQKMIEANLAKQYHDAGGWLYKLLTIQGQNTQNIKFDDVFKGGTTADFLDQLAKLGLHPDSVQNRKDFTDVLLVAANMENLTDAGAAHRFLADTFLDWATREFQRNRFGNASYLSLLAMKHGNSAANEIFGKARAAGMDQLAVIVAAQPPANLVSSTDKDFSDDLYNTAISTAHDSLLPWMKYEDSGNSSPAAASNFVFRVKIKAGVSKFSSDYQRVARKVSREFPVTVNVDNPAIPAAQQAVTQAQANLVAAQRAFESAKQSAAAAAEATRQAANQMGGGMMGAFMGGLASGVVANSVSTAGVDQANQALAAAQNALANMPLQVEQTQNKLFTWNETDHITTYHTSYQISFGVTDGALSSQSFSAAVTHKSTERRGIDQVNLAPMEREQPDLQKIESILAADLKKQMLAYGKLGTLTGIRTALSKFYSGEGAGSDPEAGLDTRLNLEFLWWDSTLRDYRAFATSGLLGRFGDVISEPVPASRKKSAGTDGAKNPSEPLLKPQDARSQSSDSPAPINSAPSAPAAARGSSPAAINNQIMPDQGNLVGHVMVMGEVRKPSASIPCKEKTTVLGAIQAAGGFTDVANTSAVQVFPQGKLSDAFAVDCTDASKDPVVHSGDHIVVQRRPSVGS